MLTDCAFSKDRLPSECRLIRRVRRKRGVVAAIRTFASLISVYVKQGLLLTILKPACSFVYRGEAHKYFHHWKVTTFLNERAIEIPIVIGEIQKSRPQTLLEIGNVLSHYTNLSHTVVDKYEVAEGVVNIDVVDFDPVTEFDMIVSISTLEHVGWDEIPKEKEKTLKALNNLERLLNRDGRLICTFPWGYNLYLDKLLEDNRLPFSQLLYFKRFNFKNEWQEGKDGNKACELHWTARKSGLREAHGRSRKAHYYNNFVR